MKGERLHEGWNMSVNLGLTLNLSLNASLSLRLGLGLDLPLTESRLSAEPAEVGTELRY